MRSLRILACCLALTGFGCEDEVVVEAPPPVAPPSAPPAEPVAPAADPDAGAEPTVATFTDDDFVELETTNRDPFRTFIGMFVATAAERAQISRDVKMGDVDIDDMTVIAIVTRISPPRAMIQDPSGVGYVVRPRDFLGRPETVQVGSDIPVQLQWQVARVRANEVVLSRTDPTAPDRPPLTRILPLYNEDELEEANLSIR
ncbi:MAG: hypothetical protein CMN30_00370 [Sandaracinus sp.]|nr:hypothetical protein [Sandaracinus sp.]